MFLVRVFILGVNSIFSLTIIIVFRDRDRRLRSSEFEIIILLFFVWFVLIFFGWFKKYEK